MLIAPNGSTEISSKLGGVYVRYAAASGAWRQLRAG